MAVGRVSSTTSIYGNRNVITGLASGMDTESMIQNAISGYQSKINSLSQQRTKIEWKQEAYRSIVTKMAAFTGKYADYRSSTNLMSPSFFNQAIKTVTEGSNASKVSASGKTSSSVQINSVKQLATATTYRVDGAALNSNMSVDENGRVSVTAKNIFDLSGKQTVSTVEGSLTISYGGSSARTYLDISFGELDNFENAQEMVDHINKQLADQSITTSSGDTKKASEMLRATVDGNGNIAFEDASGSGNQFYISSASGRIKDTLGVQTGSNSKGITVGNTALTEDLNVTDYLATATMDITLDGVKKSIKLPNAEKIVESLDWSKVAGGEDGETGQALKEAILNGSEIEDSALRQLRDDAFQSALQAEIDDKFGKLSDGTSKLIVRDVNEDVDGGYKGIQLQFTAGQQGSSFSVGGSKAAALGMATSGTTSYLSTSQTLKDLGVLTDDMAYKRDSNGNIEYEKNEDGSYKLNDDGEKIPVYNLDSKGNKLYTFEINGVKIGEYTEDTALATIMNQINNNKEAGVNVSYSKTTNEFTFTATETGVAGKVDFGDGLASALFGGGTKTAGQDAIFEATVNGTKMNLTRSSNTVDMDGMTVTLKGTFEDNGDPVTFTSSADADKIVDAIKSMVNDYNEMVTEIKNAYSTLPLQRSNGAYYQPLTDDDMADMTESAIEKWNNNAKTGILFGDSDLANLYARLTKAVSRTGADGADLKAAGITINYSNGLTTLAFDENQLRSTLETDPDRVTEIFTKTTDSGSATKGFLEAMKEPLDLYGKTEGVNLSTGTKGVLVNLAGHPLAASTLYTNTIQKQLDKIDEQISTWQDKMSDRVDYYTNKFSQLEQLIAQMNSQSSTLSGLMGMG